MKKCLVTFTMSAAAYGDLIEFSMDLRVDECKCKPAALEELGEKLATSMNSYYVSHEQEPNETPC